MLTPDNSDRKPPEVTCARHDADPGPLLPLQGGDPLWGMKIELMEPVLTPAEQVAEIARRVDEVLGGAEGAGAGS